MHHASVLDGKIGFNEEDAGGGDQRSMVDEGHLVVADRSQATDDRVVNVGQRVAVSLKVGVHEALTIKQINLAAAGQPGVAAKLKQAVHSDRAVVGDDPAVDLQLRTDIEG